ncbi:hypothetical protein [Acanthopleuribacter pedis]|uniref:Uncharacterized protein n=1 Tax=Acanthopleuribacter pedis TaxID=442870 RepID=A0A8J7U793_9BACT|nr:hypothetical protein [Acanthopleuribacter pedis]MBO1322754.1 hypothetical protein [Acanthopleuribacter pedis]
MNQSEIRRSSDGLNWETVYQQGFGSSREGLTGIAWSGSEFLVTAGEGPLLTSTDGSQWVEAGRVGDWFASGVRWLNDQWMVHENTHVAIRCDAVTWLTVTPGPENEGFGSLDRHPQHGYRLVGINHVYQSQDGLVWTRVEGAPALIELVAGAEGFLGRARSMIYSSPDGITWVPEFSANLPADIFHDGNQFVVVEPRSVLNVCDAMVPTP